MTRTSFAQGFNARDLHDRCDGCGGVGPGSNEECCGEKFCGRADGHGCLAYHRNSDECVDPDVLADRMASAIDAAELNRGGR